METKIRCLVWWTALPGFSTAPDYDLMLTEAEAVGKFGQPTHKNETEWAWY